MKRQLSLSARAWLAIEIVLVYANVRWTLRRHHLPETVRILRGKIRPRRLAPLAAGHVNPRSLAAAVVMTLHVLPFDSRCLMRSLTLMRILARRGIAVDLLIAALPTGPQTLDAHAWVEIDGAPLLRPTYEDTGFGHLVTL
jgi:Transglutaminase-like superfamily